MIQSKKPESPEQWASVFQNYPYDFFIGVIEESIINNFHDDEEDKEQLTPLHLLIKYNKNKGKAEMMQKMIELNADINTPTSITKRTPLLFVAQYDPEPKLFQKLIKKGAKIDAQDNKTYSLCHYLTMNKPNLRTIKFCHDLGIKMNLRTNDKITPLHFLCSKPVNIAILKLFLTFEIDVNETVNSKNQTILHLVCSLKNPMKIIIFLIEKNAKVNIVDKDGNTPLHYLAKNSNNHDNSVDYMLKNNAKKKIKNNNNKTAVDLAYEYKNDNFLCEIIWGKIDNNNRDLKYQHSKILEQLNSETKKKKKYIKEIESFKGRIVKMEKEIKVKSDLIENLKEKNKKKLERSINQQQSTLKNTVEENENLKKQIQRVNKKIEKYIEEKSKIEEHIKKYVQLIKDEKRKVIQLNEKIKKINKK